MTEQKNNIVGILQNHEMLAIIQALEKFEKEVKEQEAALEKADTFDDEWVRVASLAVSVNNALGMLRLIQKDTPSPHPKSAYTIHWEGSLEKAMGAWGKTFRPELREE